MDSSANTSARFPKIKSALKKILKSKSNYSELDDSFIEETSQTRIWRPIADLSKTRLLLNCSRPSSIERLTREFESSFHRTVPARIPVQNISVGELSRTVVDQEASESHLPQLHPVQNTSSRTRRLPAGRPQFDGGSHLLRRNGHQQEMLTRHLEAEAELVRIEYDEARRNLRPTLGQPPNLQSEIEVSRHYTRSTQAILDARQSEQDVSLRQRIRDLSRRYQRSSTASIPLHPSAIFGDAFRSHSFDTPDPNSAPQNYAPTLFDPVEDSMFTFQSGPAIGAQHSHDHPQHNPSVCRKAAKEISGHGSVDPVLQNTVFYSYKVLNVSKTDLCTICMCSLSDGENARRLPCLHVFHSGCVDRWLSRKAICPTCRTEVQDFEEEP